MNKYLECKGQIFGFGLYYITLEINYIIHTLYNNTYIYVNLQFTIRSCIFLWSAEPSDNSLLIRLPD